ncbi:hypothetical protein LPW11_16600 [Geomonas sp. RF6]|uniref:hypothetical protein n=1 Tax=Geomonas sp. RF6 TaxID=2897342 RepID=UPI001E3FD124|nr:hypothetical protein [Geomonas sp. RF6]UFS69507.1 hypothetical protein LPW11_16600 [Geomonas sp. RF6]
METTVHGTADNPQRSSFRVRTYPAIPAPVYFEAESDLGLDLDSSALIRAIGIGRTGRRNAELLARKVPGMTCHEIIPAPHAGNDCEELECLLTAIGETDLAFVLAGADDKGGNAARAIGTVPRARPALTIAVVADAGGAGTSSGFFPGEEGGWYDTLFGVSEQSLPEQDEPRLLQREELAGYAMRHLVGTVTTLITHMSGICIDFADIRSIMLSGKVGSLGVGIDSGPTRGAAAALRALDRLKAQGVSIAEAKGVLVAVHGSSTLTMDEFDDASRVIHGAVDEDANIVVGLVSEEQAGGNVKVTVMCTHGIRR